MEWPKKKELNSDVNVSLMQLVERAKINEANQAIDQCTEAAVEIIKGLKLPLARYMDLHEYNKILKEQCEKIDTLINQLRGGK